MVNMAANLLIVVATPLVGLSFALPGDGRLGFVVTAALWLAAVLVVPTVRELEPAPASSAPDSAGSAGLRR
jgi:MFS-type transporter involved in bile tolerance (Atg22 family)